MTKYKCHDCGCEEGEIHEQGCDVERCPFCGYQLLSCNCRYTRLGYNFDESKPFCGLPKNIYEHGLTDEQYKKWLCILEKKGRISFILYPLICARCGKLWPEFFKVSDEEWEKYIQRDKRNSILCKDCYNDIKQLIDSGTLINQVREDINKSKK
jgi:hypothetical protein